MQRVHAIEEPLVEIAPEAGLEADAALGDPAALAARLLALLGGEACEVVLKARVAAIGPVKLAVAAHEPARLRAGAARRLIEKERVHGGERLALASHRPCDLLRAGAARARGIRTRAQQKSRAGRRREGHGDRELRVVVAAGARVGLRPGEIEYEFAVGVHLHVRGHARPQGPRYRCRVK